MSKFIHGGEVEHYLDKYSIDLPLSSIIDFSVNINFLTQNTDISRLIQFGSFEWKKYPLLSELNEAYKQLATYHNCTADNIFAANGATELFYILLSALGIKTAGALSPSYTGYEEVASKMDIPFSYLTKHETFSNLELPDIFFIGYPNNPDGSLCDHRELLELISQHPKTYFIIDESFIDFTREAFSFTSVLEYDNLIVVKSLTKFFSIAGVRLGVLFSNSKIVNLLKAKDYPWHLNSLSIELLKVCYKDRQFIKETIEETELCRKYLQGIVKRFGLEVIGESKTNFILLKAEDNLLHKKLLREGIFTRVCSDFAELGEQYVRIAVREMNDIKKLESALERVFNLNSSPSPKSRAKAIMVVGTTSNAGKSIVTTAICRILSNRGMRVAPYKAQNMALNSFVTSDGKEIGRAQAVQAKSARVNPTTDMNPVLLKPIGNKQSQLIVNGIATENVTARDYYSKKSNLKFVAREAYERLASEYDWVVLEGAGSPAEINLMKYDFVNMAAAEYADASTILVADIDRGGVFASIVGTILLLPDNYRRLIKGIIINKFRGDSSLLDSGINDVEQITGIPVIGVLPYLKDLKIEEEDSLGLDARGKTLAEALLNIKVVRLPMISNYTDFLPLEHIEGIELSYVTEVNELEGADIIIIPGTKNSCSDLEWLWDKGFAQEIIEQSSMDCMVIGICGGYQMLGAELSDLNGVEGKSNTVKGLGLLPIRTELQSSKELIQVELETNSRFPYCEEGTKVTGYEIHCGETVESESSQFLSNSEATVSNHFGSISKGMNVWGTYVHGIFDSPNFLEQFINSILNKKNIAQKIDVKATNDCSEFDRLAEHLEQNIDLSKIIDSYN